ncbi:MAG: hypothetical protein IKG14_04825 [Clostridia bacterium]|nr:hypothetical protein [Clostridia bacterium]
MSNNLGGKKSMKELAIDLINKFPDDADLSDIIDELYVRINVLQGINDIENGHVYTTEEINQHIDNASKMVKQIK